MSIQNIDIYATVEGLVGYGFTKKEGIGNNGK